MAATRRNTGPHKPPAANGRKTGRPSAGSGSPTPYEATTIAHAADPHASRCLTIDYPALVEGLLSLPDPKPSAMESTLAAADLLAVAGGSSYNFGRATRENPAQADFVRQILAVPEAAFEEAHKIIGDPYESEERPARKSRNGREAARALMQDHAMGREFFHQLYALLSDAPAALSPQSGEEIF